MEGVVAQEYQHVPGSQPVAPELFGGTAAGVSRTSATRALHFESFRKGCLNHSGGFGSVPVLLLEDEISRISLEFLSDWTYKQAYTRSFRTRKSQAKRRGCMTTTQLHLFNLLYLIITAVVAILTRATPRRIAGALAGGAASGVVVLGLIALWERVGWWHMVIPWRPYFLALMLIDATFWAFIFLITWRIARRFGWRGLAMVLIVLAAIGPPRDNGT
jgi:hypothetical protein